MGKRGKAACSLRHLQNANPSLFLEEAVSIRPISTAAHPSDFFLKKSKMNEECLKQTEQTTAKSQLEAALSLVTETVPFLSRDALKTERSHG